MSVRVSIAPGPNCVANSSIVASGGKAKPLSVGVVPPPGVKVQQLQPGNLQPIITALQTLTQNQQRQQQPVQVVKTPKTFNVNVKLINPSKKSLFETYVLRGVGSCNVITPMHLKQQILEQFGSKLVSHRLDFPIGYTKLGSKLWIRTDADVNDVWSFLARGDSVSLWCHGLQSPNSEEDDTDDGSPVRKPKSKKRKKRHTAIDERNERIEDFVCQLRDRHGSKYNQLQYRLWAEMLDVKTHK